MDKQLLRRISSASGRRDGGAISADGVTQFHFIFPAKGIDRLDEYRLVISSNEQRQTPIPYSRHRHDVEHESHKHPLGSNGHEHHYNEHALYDNEHEIDKQKLQSKRVRSI